MLSYRLTIFYCFLAFTGMTQQNFQEQSEAVGLAGTEAKNISISISDYDGDGHDDFYVGRIGEPNLLFRNTGNGTFQDVATSLGLALGDEDLTYAATWGDIDNDGDSDLYIGNRLSPDQLFRNDGNGSFTNITVTANIDNVAAPRSVLFADVDQDGWLDIYVTNLNEENVLYYNLGDNTFAEQAAARGVLDDQLSLGAIFFDYDQDNDLDLYLTHDNNQANILYQNNGTGYFTDVSAASGTNYEGFGMGLEAADINNDGFPDLYITNLYDNILLLNQGDGTFEDISLSAGINDLGMGWGITFLDYDNDGWMDIYVVNDSNFSPLTNKLYRNQGDNTFLIVSEGQVESSFFSGYASASLDFNTDGRPDLLVSNIGATGGLQYFQNVTVNENHWLRIQLEGVESNRDAIGATITLESEDLRLSQEVNAGSGYAAQNSRWQHFGLADNTIIDVVRIRWPSGLVDEIENVAVDQSIRITEGGAIVNTTVLEVPAFSYSLYPNPAGNWLQLQLNTVPDEAIRVNLYDLQGRQLPIVEKNSFAPQQQALRLSVGHLPSGVYSIRLNGEGWEESQLFVK